MSIITDKIKILALHGSGSNSFVTKMQFENLGLLNPEYEISYVDGPLSVDIPGPGVDELIKGPWFSWFPRDTNGMLPEGTALLNGICEALQRVLAILETEGPFDGIFGFSQGAVVASLVNGLPQDTALLAALEARMGRKIGHLFDNGVPFRAALFACAAAPMPLSELRSLAGLGAAPLIAPTFQNLHLIGRKDEHKPWSESLALSLNSPLTKVLYLPDGHEISRLQRADADLLKQVRLCFARPQVATVPAPLQWQQSSNFSARAMADDVQITAVRVDTGELPQTISGMLAAQPASAPLFRLARERDSRIVTTYGQMLAFCQPGGEGDLRRIGVRAGDVVAYLAPAGGSATAAAAFLSIAAQTCAVPFSPNMSESDALVALKQYRVQHIVLFDGVAAPGVRAAFDSYAGSGFARMHHANHLDSPRPGLFRFLASQEGFEQLPVLSNPPDADCLLLRTSGTTSLPKVVPLRHRDLVLNGAILADGIGINASDVTYSVMPLDHIGGLSASILCSIAVGASVTCEGAYNPQAMAQALSDSNPRPTWYSAVPTIHNATVRYLHEHAEQYLTRDGKWHGHNLRLIRSGAAALKETDRSVLESTFDCPVVATYSMSEQMPISQPPRSDGSWVQQPGAVGVPVAASMAVVDPVTLRPQPFGVAGDIAISGPTVFAGYLDNPAANQQSRFLMRSHEDGQLHTWFLTGDLGEMDQDGTLLLRGRIKELIKRGGEQVAPAEVEDIVVQLPWVNTAVCFSVPSDLYGEEVGIALVVKPASAGKISHRDAVQDMRDLLRKRGLAAYKFPTHVKLVAEDDLPKTASKKYIRNGLAEVLGLPLGDAEQAAARSLAKSAANGDKRGGKSAGKNAGKNTDKKPGKDADNYVGGRAAASAALASLSAPVVLQEKPIVDWATLNGLRFLLACYVMFMHFGSEASWGAVANLRQFPWHVPTFFALAGFTLAASMPSLITRKWSFTWARISGMYPLYGLAVLIAIGNLLVSCNPSTFSPIFHWIGQASGTGQMFCEGTPLLQDSWVANLFSTVAVYLTGLQATPLWGASWFMGFYLWFISMYFQCLIIFPFLYNALYKNRGNVKRLLWLTILGLVVNVVILLGFWYGYAVDGIGAGFYDQVTGLKTVPNAAQLATASQDNAVILGFYLFAPFWMVYFIVGACAAFLYDAIRPAEKGRGSPLGLCRRCNHRVSDCDESAAYFTRHIPGYADQQPAILHASGSGQYHG